MRPPLPIHHFLSNSISLLFDIERGVGVCIINDFISPRISPSFHPQKLEQEKHNLRQKLLLAESDGDVRVLELQADLKELSQKLDVQEQNVRQAEREKAALIDELSQQNQRLTVQLQEANTLEVQLNVQLQEVRDQYSQRNTSLQVSVGGMLKYSVFRSKIEFPKGNSARVADGANFIAHLVNPDVLDSPVDNRLLPHVGWRLID